MKRFFREVAALTLSTLLIGAPALPVLAVASGTDWVMTGVLPQGGSNASGEAATSLPPYTMKWYRGDIGDGPGSHPIVSGNTVLLKSYTTHSLYALNKSTGATIWSVDTGDNNSETRALAVKDGLVYVLNTVQKKFSTFRISDGSLVKQVDLSVLDPISGGNNGSSAVVVDNTYVYMRYGNIFQARAIADLSVAWQFDLHDQFHGSKPAIYNGKVFISTRDTHLLYALNGATGAVVWTHDYGSSNASTDGNPLVYPAGNSVIQETNSGTFSFNADSGASIWSRPDFGGSYQINSSLIGNILITSRPDGVGSINADTGAINWINTSQPPFDWPDQEMPIVNGYVYFPGGTGYINAYNLATGVQDFSYKRKAGSATGLTYSDGNIYGSEGFAYYAYTNPMGSVGTFSLTHWNLSSALSVPAVQPGKTVTISATTSMLKRDPQAATDNLVQAVLPDGTKQPLSYVSGANGSTTWQLTYTVPVSTNDGVLTGTIEAAAYNTSTQTITHFDTLPTDFNNSGVTSSWSVRVDHTSPTGSVAITGFGITPGTIVLGLSGADSVVNGSSSGVVDMQISNSKTFNGAVWQPYAASAEWQLASPLDPVFYKVRDAAGNESATYTANTSFAPLKLLKYDVVGISSLMVHYYSTSNHPTLSGTATPNSQIQITIHSNPITCTTTTDANGNWACTPVADVPNGEHIILVQELAPNGVYGEVTIALGVNVRLAATGDNTRPITIGAMIMLILLGLGTGVYKLAPRK